MSMTLRVDLEIPDTVSPSLTAELKREMKHQAVLSLFRRGQCSAGVAARILHVSLHDFLEILKTNGIAYAPGDADDTAEDQRTLEWLDDQAAKP